MSNAKPSAAQVEVILEGIAADASDAERLALMLSRVVSENSCSSDEAYALASAVVSIAQRIGWAADLALGGSIKGDASSWMMPPAFHDSGERGKEN